MAEPAASKVADRAVTQASPVHVAAIWFLKAKSGSVQWVSSCPAWQVQDYCLRKQLKFVRALAKYFILLAAVVETPSYCLRDASLCRVSAGMLQLPPLPVTMFTFTLWWYLLFDLWLRFRSLGEAHTFTGWHAVGSTLVVVAFLDNLVALFNTTGLMFWTTFRISRLIRPVIFMAFTKSLREAAGRVVRSVPYFIDMLAGLAICLLLFAWTGVVIFSGTPEGQERFKDGSSAITNLWVLFEGGAGNPDVWLPAFKQHFFFFFFFLAFCLLTVYILNSMLLSSIYGFYKEKLKEDVKAFFDARTFALERAFDLLKDERGHITLDRWEELYACVCDPGFGYRMPWAKPPDAEYNRKKAKQFFEALDRDASGGIDLNEFTCLIDALLDEESYVPTTPAPLVISSDWAKPYHRLFTEGIPISLGSGQVRLEWDYFVDGVIVIDVLLVLCQTFLFVRGGSDYHIQSRLGIGTLWFWVLFLFAVFYTVATSLKLRVFGFERFWNMKPVQHRFDFFSVYPLFIATLLRIVCAIFTRRTSPSHFLLKAIVLLHIIRILRVIVYVPALNYLARFLVKLAPTYYRMGMLLLLIFYLYTTLGLHFFGGLLYAGNPALAGSDYASSNYFAFHFNDFNTGMVTLFNLMMLNSWNVFSAAFVSVTGSKWAVVFSISFFVIVNLIVLNILIALIIDCASSIKGSAEDAREGGDLSYYAVLKRVLLQDEAAMVVQQGAPGSAASTSSLPGSGQRSLYGATETSKNAASASV
jgi:two pore calcium channel protein